MGGLVRCAMTGDVLLLLKASEAVDCLPEPSCLTLTAWDDNILPTNQFRCFVRHKKLLCKVHNTYCLKGVYTFNVYLV